jgi:NarL family two-component system response regulator LiaR
MIRVLICDDQEIVCEGLQKILATDPQIEVVGSAFNGREALALVAETQPDLVLMDLKMPEMNGILATQHIRATYPRVRVLVLTTYDEDEWLFDAIRAGASGYLLKDTPRADLLRAVIGTVSGDSYVDPAITGKLLNSLAHSPSLSQKPTQITLNERETEILRLLAHGLTNADIAARLYLSEGTVRNYTSAIFAKLGVSDRTQAAVAALRYGLVDLNE